MARAIFVVIPTAGRPKLLRRTLASLAACEKPSNYRGTYVVENGPKGEAEWIVEAHRSELGARYLYLPGANKSRALNAALEQVEDGLIFFTDDDVRLAAHVLSRYAEASADVDGGFFYGGPLGVDYERQPPEWVRSRLPPSAVGWCLNGTPEDETWKYFSGANWAAFARDLGAAGGFDARYGPGASTRASGQETSMHWRLLERGVEMEFVPGAVVWHYVPAERCSPAWAAQRRYRAGVAAGLELSRKAPPGPWLGYPGWMISRWLRLAVRLVARAAGRDRARRFDAYTDLRYHTGYLRGFRRGHRMSDG